MRFPLCILNTGYFTHSCNDWPTPARIGGESLAGLLPEPRSTMRDFLFAVAETVPAFGDITTSNNETAGPGIIRVSPPLQKFLQTTISASYTRSKWLQVY